MSTVQSGSQAAASLKTQQSPIFIRLAERYPELRSCIAEITAAAEMLVSAAKNGSKILICGNGGSSADADHICGELLKAFCKKRPVNKALADRLRGLDAEAGTLLAGKLQAGLPAISLTFHNALTTAFANDVDPDLVFAQQ